jgi:hypothetical protein
MLNVMNADIHTFTKDTKYSKLLLDQSALQLTVLQWTVYKLTL